METPLFSTKTSSEYETCKQNFSIHSTNLPGRGYQMPTQSPIYEPMNSRQSTFSQSSSSPSPSYSNIGGTFKRCPQPNYSYGIDFHQQVQQVPLELESEEYNQGKSPQYISIQQNNNLPMQPQYHNQPYLQYLPVQSHQQKRQTRQLNYSQDSYEQINSNPVLNYQFGQQQQPQKQHFSNPQYFNDTGMYSNSTRLVYTASQKNLFESTRQNLSRLLPTQPRDRAIDVQSSIQNLGMQNYQSSPLEENYQNEHSNDNFEFRSNLSLNYAQQGQQQFQQRQQQQHQKSPQQYRDQQHQYQSQESGSFEGQDSCQSLPASQYRENNSQSKIQKEWYEQQDDDEDDGNHHKDDNNNKKAESIGNSPRNTQQSDENTNVTASTPCCSNKGDTIQHTLELQQYLHNKQMKTKYIESSSNSIVSGIIDMLNTRSKKNKCIVKEIFHDDQRKYTCCPNCKELANEIQILSKLSHPSIIPISNNQNYSNQPILKLPHSCAVFLPRAIMDLFDFALTKPDTSDYTKRNYQLLKMAFKQTAEAIDYLHKKNIIHGDIKPENILVFSQTQFKLADFGFAKQAQTYRSRQSFLDRFKDRSLKYYPPEVSEALEDGNYDVSKIDEFSNDVFALGVSMFQVFFKSFPYGNETSYCNVYDENAEEKYSKQKYFHRADKVFGILYNSKKTHLFWNKFQEIENILTIGKAGCASMKLLEMNQLKQLIAHSITPMMYQRYSIQEFLQHPFFTSMK